ncbi:MAG TPA: choice-of-anchor Q domain-containing protein [Flavilitoribacter sp.]|nr:choice-of-anchor Q domain-containing protein [Flavilitoribacter sp.]HMQ86768.1 choice-of-anchor Q domain-containing protein [Flavilitoribacter sp.]
MKKLYWLIAGMLLISATAFSQVVYVKGDASGTNDGTSWANAYTSLSNALANTSSGEVWVAAGTYVPGTDTLSSFSIGSAIAVYGGFAGTETSVDQRDPAANVTILSGDVNGDDVADDFDTNKSDNVFHVVYVDSLIASPVIIDGFTIQNGHNHALADGAETFLERGAGIWAYSPVAVSNCMFTQNSGGAGSGVALMLEGTDGSSFEDVTFDSNRAIEAGVVYALGTADLMLNNVTFSNNLVDGGALYSAYSLGVTIDNSNFVNNTDTVTSGFAAGMFLWQNVDVLVSNTVFSGNSADNAAAYYIDGAEIQGDLLGGYTFDNVTHDGNTVTNGFGVGYFYNAYDVHITNSSFVNNNSPVNAAGLYANGTEVAEENQDPANFVVENTLFENNFTSGRGAGVYFNNLSARVNGCDLLNNTGGVIAGAMYIRNLTGAPVFTVEVDNSNFNNNSAQYGAGIGHLGSNSEMVVKNSHFEENSGTQAGGAIYFGATGVPTVIDSSEFINNSNAFGGAVCNFADGAQTIFRNSLFKGNSVSSSGGGMLNGFDADVVVEKCTFEANVAAFGGGIRVQNDNVPTYVYGSTFDGNMISGTSSGGGIGVFGVSPLTIDSCFFVNNQAGGSGAAVFVGQDTTLPVSLSIDRSLFRLNTATNQGGAVNIGNFNTEINNCLFTGNATNDPGTGGAISTNASDTVEIVVNIYNSTFAEDLGVISGEIATWTDPTTPGFSLATLNLANNIFYNSGQKNYAIEDGETVVLSLGGNLAIDPDGTLDIYLTEASDKLAEDPLFVDPTGFGNPDGIPDLHLQAGSPAIDAALPAFASAFDLDGNPRPQGDGPDIGAYEFTIVRAEEVLANNGLLTIAPNPVKDEAVLQVKGAGLEGALTVRIADNNGRVLRQIAVRKTGDLLSETINVAGLPAGAYTVMVTNGKQMVVSTMIKQ